MKDFTRLIGYMKPYLGRLAAASLMLALAGALMSVVVATMKPLTNDVLLPQRAPAAAAPAAPPEAPPETGSDVLQKVRSLVPLDRWTSWARGRAYVQVPLLIVVIFLVRAVLLYFGQYLTTKVGVSVIRDLRADLHRAITFQSLDFFQANPTGTLLSRVLSDVQRIRRVSTNVLADLVRVGAMVPFMFAVALVHDWRMTLLALVALPLLAYPMIRLGKRLRRVSTRSQETMAEAAGLLAETVGGIRVVQGFGMERFEIRRFREALNRMLRVDLKAGRAAALAPALMELMGAVAGAVLFYLAGRAIARGVVDRGDFMVVLSSLGFLFISVRRLNQLNVEIQQALAAATRVFAIMDRPRTVREKPDAEELPPFSREIRLDSLQFAYERTPVLRGIDLVIRKGDVVALVGASGSGKSTLAALVPRFYDPTSGRVLVDGHDLRDVTLASLRGQIGLVTQETILFNDTVRNNIAYGRADIPVERVVAAARAAQAHEFIEEMPEGYDTVLGERGARLSMGERQRIAIARALVKDPPILILDEATSALDSQSEVLVEKALETLMAGRTSIVIAHRLATVRRAHRILVMEAGRIVEEGTHKDLLARGGLYTRLHALQFRD